MYIAGQTKEIEPFVQYQYVKSQLNIPHPEAALAFAAPLRHFLPPLILRPKKGNFIQIPNAKLTSIEKSTKNKHTQCVPEVPDSIAEAISCLQHISEDHVRPKSSHLFGPLSSSPLISFEPIHQQKIKIKFVSSTNASLICDYLEHLISHLHIFGTRHFMFRSL